MKRFLPAFLGLLSLSSPAAAHPVPTTGYDREVAVRLGATGVTVRYTLEVSPLTLYTDAARVLTPEEIGHLNKTIRGLVAAYSKKLAPEIAGHLHATVDGTRLPFRITSITPVPDQNPRIVFVFQAAWPPGGAQRRFAFEDGSFDRQPGPLRLTIDSTSLDDGSSLSITEEPPVGLRGRSPTDLTDEQAMQLRRVAATVTLPREVQGAKPVAEPAAVPEPQTAEPEGGRPSLAEDLANRQLAALLDSPYGLGVLLFAAFVFGAAHAFTPGHGKTLVAAYLIGERGTVWHAVLLAVATTVAHTGSVIAVAAVLRWKYGNNVPIAAQGVLQFAGGFLVLAVGLWLLLRRVTGRADHFHLFSGHHHHGDGQHGHHHGDGNQHHHHGPPPENAKSTAGWLRLVLMGLGGGMIPCWDAVLLLLGAMTLQRLDFALPLLFAFSLGLGMVLVGLGVGVVYAHRAGVVKFRESRWFRMLPLLSAVALTLLGFWLCKEGLRQVMP